jgi:hypothetical protein
VRNVLAESPFLARAEFLEAWLERETDLRDSRGSPSQSDLLALLGIDRELAVLGVEAKVDESFGPLVSEWMQTDTGGKSHRLTLLCSLFGLKPDAVGHLRYQLLHRTAAVIYEAQRFRSANAVLIVHSFCRKPVGLDDCKAFLEAIKMPGLREGGLVGPQKFGGVLLWAGWAADVPLESGGADAHCTGVIK